MEQEGSEGTIICAAIPRSPKARDRWASSVGVWETMSGSRLPVELAKCIPASGRAAGKAPAVAVQPAGGVGQMRIAAEGADAGAAVALERFGQLVADCGIAGA